MELIREIYDKDIGGSKSNYTKVSYTIRKASRAIVFNEDNDIAILNVTKDKYHKLPGGGIEDDEDIITALRRELIEEVGVEVEVTGTVGCIIEYRNEFNQLQISYCYDAQVVKDYKKTSFTEVEIADGFKLEWMSLKDAVEMLSKDEPKSYVGRFIKERDLTFLKFLASRY